MFTSTTEQLTQGAIRGLALGGPTDERGLQAYVGTLTQTRAALRTLVKAGRVRVVKVPHSVLGHYSEYHLVG